MISIKLTGGLGNQMFQYAMVRAMQLENKEEAYMSLDKFTNKSHDRYTLNHLNISKNIKIVDKTISPKNIINSVVFRLYTMIFSKKHETSTKRLTFLNRIINKFGCAVVVDSYIPINLKSRNKYIFGYFQSLKYFDKYNTIIRNELKIKDRVKKKNEKILIDINDCESVCIHVRRGDYVGSIHEVCTKEYYNNAIDNLSKQLKNKDVRYFIFSDDISWCKDNLSLNNKKVYYMENNTSYDDLRLMYNCKHFIMSNSTFSWWGQYLSDNKDKIVYAPKKWFNNKWDNPDLYMDDWHLI